MVTPEIGFSVLRSPPDSIAQYKYTVHQQHTAPGYLVFDGYVDNPIQLAVAYLRDFFLVMASPWR